MENIGPEEIRLPAIDNIEIIPKTKHLCWLYENDDDRLTVVQPFLVAGLSRRKQCLLVVPAAVRETIFLDLTEGDVNVKRYQETGQMIQLEPEDFFFNGGSAIDIDTVMHRLAAALSQATAQGWQGLAIVTDPSEMLGRAKDEDWLALEFRADYECYTRPCMMLCLYDQRRISGSLLAALVKAHPVIGLGNALARNPFYAAPTPRTS